MSPHHTQEVTVDSQLFPLLFLVLIGLAFYALVIRPARARQAQQSAVVASLQPGVRVLLASGMVGEIVAVHDDDLQIRIAPGVVVTFVKQAVLRQLDPAGTADDAVASSTTDEVIGTD
jgi:preprotein translocase subunit YajC